MPKRHRAGASATSLLRHVEEIVLATSGQDAFEVVFAVATAICAPGKRTPDKRTPKPPLRRAIAEAAARSPHLEVAWRLDVDDVLLERVDALLRASLAAGHYAALDAVFEALVPRVAKADKGQFFTPRHVVDFVVRMLAPAAGEIVLDPACGSGAFLAHARALADVAAHGADVDPRAVRVARLLALASAPSASKSSRPSRAPRIVRADGLRTDALPLADVVATNPPFAGRAPAEGFAVADLVRTPERDVLFLERAIRLLRPGGRLGIVLPYNKANGGTFDAVRRWLVEQARIYAVVGLPKETFLPHTSQRTVVLFARKRSRPRAFAKVSGDPAERTMFVLSERAGKDAGGEPIFAEDGRELDHDLAAVSAELEPFLAVEGFHQGRAS